MEYQNLRHPLFGILINTNVRLCNSKQRSTKEVLHFETKCYKEIITSFRLKVIQNLSTSESTSSSSSDVATGTAVVDSTPQVPYHPVPAPRLSKVPQRAATAPVLVDNPVVESKAGPPAAKPSLPTSDQADSQKVVDPFNMPALDFGQDLSKSTPNIPDKTNNNLPEEQSKNVSVSRHNAFYNMERPSSVKRRSMQGGAGVSLALNQQAVKEARTAFMQSEVTKPNLGSGSIMEFDLLTMGSDSSLSSIGSGKNVGGGLKSGAHVDNGDSQEDLLKEWNLDTHFTKMKIDKTSTLPAQHPPLPPQIPASAMRSTIMGGAGFGGNFTGVPQKPPPMYGIGTTQQYPGVPAPYPSSVNSLLSNSGYNRNSMPPLSSNSPIHAQLAALQRSQSPSNVGQVGPPMLRPLSVAHRSESPDKPNRDSRGTSPAIAQTIASLNAAAEFHMATPSRKVDWFLGSVKKVITNIEQTQTNLDILNDLSFLQNSSDGVNSSRNTPSPSLQNNQTNRKQWETFD